MAETTAPNAPASGNGLQTCDASSHHKNFGRRNGAGRRRHHRKQFRQRRGPQQHRAVAGNGGHAGKHIHGLGASDSRHQFQGEQRDAAAGKFFRQFRLRKRIAHGDQNLRFLKMIQIGAAGIRVRTQCADLQQQLGGKRIAARADGRTFFGVLLIWKSGRFARTSLHKDGVADLHQARYQIWR